MDALYLTQAEQRLFQALPAALSAGGEVKDETQQYEETSRKRSIRFQIARLHDPALLRFREKALDTKSEDEFRALVQSVDLGKISERDMGQLLFALGPNGLSVIISGILKNAVKAEDIAMAASFSELRHELLASLNTVSA
jgi:hypothetical protein